MSNAGHERVTAEVTMSLREYQEARSRVVDGLYPELRSGVGHFFRNAYLQRDLPRFPHDDVTAPLTSAIESWRLMLQEERIHLLAVTGQRGYIPMNEPVQIGLSFAPLGFRNAPQPMGEQSELYAVCMPMYERVCTVTVRDQQTADALLAPEEYRVFLGLMNGIAARGYGRVDEIVRAVQSGGYADFRPDMVYTPLQAVESFMQSFERGKNWRIETQKGIVAVLSSDMSIVDFRGEHQLA